MSLPEKEDANILHLDPKSRVVVLGASGWIGANLVRFLVSSTRCAVECWVRREAAAASLRRILDDESRLTVRCSDNFADLEVPPDTRVVVHGASPTDHWDVPGSIATNVSLTWRLLDELSGRRVPVRFVYLSTLLVRGDSPAPFSERDFDAGQSFLTPYAQAKFLAESMIRTTYTNSVEAIILRLGSVLWSRQGSELPHGNWLCQSARLWHRGALPIIPLFAEQRFHPIPVDELCALIWYLIVSPSVPRVVHLPYDAGPTLTSVFELLARKTGLPIPRFCASDSDQWTEFLASLPPSVMKRRIAALFPVPPKGAKLSPVDSEQSREWIERGGFKCAPLPEAYWTHILATSS